MSKQAVRIICFGASNTWGYDPRSFLGDRYPADVRWTELLAARTGWTVLNRGENGREIPHSPEEFRLLDSCIREAEPPDLLILDLGINDLMRMYPVRAEGAADRMRGLLHHLQENFPALRILLLAPGPVRIPEEELTRQAQRLCRCYETLAREEHADYLDPGNLDPAWDGIHLSEQGHRQLAERLAGYLTVPQFPDSD